MRLLCIDTSSTVGGVAVFDSVGGLLADLRVNLVPDKKTHSERLMPALDYILRESDTTVGSVDAFVVTTGPGSFTGLRVGINTVKGFALVSTKPVIPISTFEGLALNFPYTGYPVCVLLDARKDDLYGAVFSQQLNGDLKEIVQGGVYKLDEICEKLHGRTILTGDGSIKYKDRLQQLLGDNALFCGTQHQYISPAAVAAAGLKKLNYGGGISAEMLKPLYLKGGGGQSRADGR
ncbi:MAG: tRNA (adenosine(37)-N6)-threonylcarbamoyltransferase complex dimerization subunit type 1 TsaB [Nitrospirae bacterium YQR-1]